MTITPQEMEDFECFRLNNGGFLSDNKDVFNMFKRIKALAESCGNTDEQAF